MLNFSAILYSQPEPKEWYYDKADIKAMQSVNKDKVDFVHSDSVARMREIEENAKIINSRATLLLGYLAAIVTGLLIILFGNLPIEIEESTKNLVEALVLVYLLNIFALAMSLISPNFLAYAHNQPKIIMEQPDPLIDSKVTKIIYINVLQENIESNTKRLHIQAIWLKSCILATFIPLIPLAWTFFVS